MRHIRAALVAAATVFVAPANASDPPPTVGAFAKVQVNSPPWDFSSLVGIDFFPDGQMVVWEKQGKVSLVGSDGRAIAPPLLDLREEVGDWSAQGMFGFAIDPDYATNGRIYVLYTVDRHHLLYFGTPAYDPDENEYEDATIARVTRYTVVDNAGTLQVDPASRFVLIGETIDTGVPVVGGQHGNGCLLFGTDKTLLVSIGDSFNGEFDDQAELDGIIRPEDRVGAWKSQSINVLNGKILRIDTETGDGIPSNPFYDPLEPRSPASRVWALGLRNPFRMTLRTGTGSHVPSTGDPGVILVGDIGNAAAEELNIVETGGQNFGWPIYEGLTSWGPWPATVKENLDAPNPLFNGVTCTQMFFYFRDLLQQDTLVPITLPNPCDAATPIPPDVPTFMHTRPALEWRRQTDVGPTSVPIYVGVNPGIAVVGDPGSPATGQGIKSKCAIAGVWCASINYPEFYRDRYYHGDWALGWMQSIELDVNNDVVDVRTVFEPDGGAANVSNIIDMAVHPITGDIFYVHFGPRIFHVYWAPSGNQPPTAVASADTPWGPAPLSVNFEGSQSFDSTIPSNQLIYRWDFGDGSPIENTPDPQHTFNAPAGTPTTFTVTLEVEDDEGLTDQTSLLVSANNSPPQITITSPTAGDLYSVDQITVFSLDAIVTDAEHSSAQLTCEWETRLYHDQHFHPELLQPTCSAVGQTTPIGCEDIAVYWYGFVLRVTDAAGLTSEQEVLVFPDCSAFTLAPVTVDDSAQVDQGESVVIDVLTNDFYLYGLIDPATVNVESAPAFGGTSVDPITGSITYTHDGMPTPLDSFTYTVKDTEGDESPPANVYLAITIECPADVTTQGAGVGDPGYGFPDGIVTGNDISYYVNLWVANDLGADVTTQGVGPGDPDFGKPDGQITAADLNYFVNEWVAGCP